MRKYLPKLITLVVASGVSGWLFAGGHEGGGLPALDNNLWRQECGSCHSAFHPGLLPERSWRKLMGGLERHFGENAGLDPASRKTITEFLAANAADRIDARRARKVAASIPPGQTPLRISETAWFERKHNELGAAVWKRKDVASRANCGACHAGAEHGRYSEHEIAVPGQGRWRG
ncbi:MAG: diheme cytochrome c [Sulfuricella sp.]|nr:diheme cytochrome c [Sulfuricella sp.]